MPLDDGGTTARAAGRAGLRRVAVRRAADGRGVRARGFRLRDAGFDVFFFVGMRLGH